VALKDLAARKVYAAAYYQKHRDYLKGRVMARAKAHPGQIKASNKAYYRKNCDRIKQRTMAYERKRRAESIEYRLRHNLRRRIPNAIRQGVKAGSAIRLLGCTIDYFKDYIAARFRPGMTWDNYGEWHLDHIKPLASFDLTDLDQMVIACYYTNMQPLWAADNMRKGARFAF